jgi:hypothetical protein
VTNTNATGSSAATDSGLLRFLILLVAICGLTCVYVWQAETISAIRTKTQEMARAIEVLERQNVNLMLDYAGWDAPAYIEAESNKSGMVVGQIPIRVPAFAEHQATTIPDAEDRVLLGQLGAWLPRSLAAGSRHW